MTSKTKAERKTVKQEGTQSAGDQMDTEASMPSAGPPVTIGPIVDVPDTPMVAAVSIAAPAAPAPSVKSSRGGGSSDWNADSETQAEVRTEAAASESTAATKRQRTKKDSDKSSQHAKNVPRTVDDEQIAMAIRFDAEMVDQSGHFSGAAARRQAGVHLRPKHIERWIHSRKDEVSEAVEQVLQRAKAVASKVVNTAKKIYATPGSCNADDFDTNRKDRKGGHLRGGQRP